MLGAVATVLVIWRLISIPERFEPAVGRSIGIWLSLLGSLLLIAAGLIRSADEGQRRDHEERDQRSDRGTGQDVGRVVGADVDARAGDQGGEEQEARSQARKEIGEKDGAGETRCRVARRKGLPDVGAQQGRRVEHDLVRPLAARLGP